MSEKTIYNFIESNVFKNLGFDIFPLDLRQVVKRRMKKKDKNIYKKRKDKRYLINRMYDDYMKYIEENPNSSIVQMDTVYNDISNGPFMQTFKFLRYGFLFIIFSNKKDSQSMYEGIILLESILGKDMFNREVEILLTDRGCEFSMADEIELRDDGSRRTRLFYCDPMRSNQKGSLENNHKEIRYICPKESDLYALGLNCQTKANLMTSHINSFPKEKLNGKSPFSLLEFLNPNMANKFIDFGISEIKQDDIILKPYLLK